MSKSPHSLLVLTLALEAAVLAEDWDEIRSLIHERDQLLASLQPDDLLPAIQESIRAADHRMLTALESKRTALVQELSEGASGRKMAATYTIKKLGGQMLDRAS